MARNKGGLCVTLQQLPISLNNVATTTAQFDSKCKTISLLNDDGLVSLLHVGSESYHEDVTGGVPVSQFVWDSSIHGNQSETKTLKQCFAVVTRQGAIQLGSIVSDGETFQQNTGPECSLESLQSALQTYTGTEISVTTDLKVVHLQGSVVTALVDNYICRLAITDDSPVEVLQCWQLEVQSQDIILIKVIQGLLVVLQNEAVISLYSLVKTEKVATVNIRTHILQRCSSTEETPKELTSFDLSDDLLLLAVSDSANNVYPIDLNSYFTQNPQYLMKKRSRSLQSGDLKPRDRQGDESLADSPGRYKGIRTDTNRTWRNHMANIKERSFKQTLCGDVTLSKGVGVVPLHHHKSRGKQWNWFQEVEGIRLPTKWVKTHEETHAGKSGQRTVCGFMKGGPRPIKPSSQSFRDQKLEPGNLPVLLSSPVDSNAMTLNQLSINETSVSAFYVVKKEATDNSVHSALCVFNLYRGVKDQCEFTEPTCMAFSNMSTHPHLLVTANSIGAVVFNEEQEGLVNKLMMYDSATVADAVCRVNRWDRCSIPIHALEVGLRHRQLDTVAFFLKSRESIFTIHPKISPSSTVTSSFHSSKKSDPGISVGASSSPFKAKMDTFQLDSAIQLLLATIKDNINADMQSRQFGEQLLHMTLEFVNQLIRNAASVAVQVSEDEDLSHEDLQSSVSKLMGYLSELRQYLKNVPKWAAQKSKVKEEISEVKEDDSDFYMPTGHFTEDCIQQWRHMKRQDVIRDGILNSCIPLVQAYLRQHDKGHGSRLSDILEVGLSQVYLSLTAKDLRNAAKMLKNMGYNVTEQLRKICLYTPSKGLRDFLSEELQKSNQLTEEEVGMVKFVHQLENLYTCRSYEQAKQIAEETRKRYWESSHRLSRTPTIKAKSVLSSLIKTGEIAPNEDNNHQNDNYAHIVLEWVRDWDEETRQRILLERVFNDKDPSLDGAVQPETRWRYLLSHNLLENILHWITENPSTITSDMLNDMTHCTPYVKDKILDEMARRGLFTSEELEDFNKLLHRLSRSTSLFVQPHVLDDSYMMNMEEFHDHFIKYCIQNYLPNVLYFYLDFYKLAVCDQELQAVASIDRDSSWFEMLLFFRYTGLKYNDPSVMFQASLANIRFILKVTQPTVTCLLEANKPIAAMATLIYAPGTLYEVTLATENEEERLWKVDPELLKQSLQTYSKLQSALFPIQTADGVTPQDITMYQLLKGNTSFDPSKLFRWQSTNNLATQGSDDFMEIPHFSRPDLANKYGHKEILRYTYYLRQGRPSFAFLTFIKSLGDGDSALVRKRIKQAYIKSYMIAVRNFKTTSISAACVVFVEMLGQDSLVMRVAIQASNIIFTHERQFVMMDQYTDKNNKEKKVKDVEEDIISDFLSILRHRRTSAEKILRHLEDAISANVKKSDEESTSFEANQQWSLAILFCHLHKLAYSSVFLEECARADQWLRFLCFAQNYQYPQQQVLELIRQFHSPNLRDHLHHAVENLQYTGSGKAAEPKDTKQAKRSQDLRMQYLKRVGISKGAVGSSTDSDKEGESHGKMEESTVTSSDTGMDVPPADIDVGHIPSDLFGVIFVCENTSQPWRHMLAHCVALRRPILAVLAACFTEASMLECLCVWSLMMMDDDCIAMVTHNMASVQWHRWSLEDVSVIIDVAMEKKYYSLLIKAFTVFDPDCALLGFFRFVKSFLVRHDGKACKIHLRQFQDAMLQCRRNLRSRQIAKIGHLDWYESIASKLTCTLLHNCTTRYDMNQFLSALTERNVTRLYSKTDYAKVYTVFKLLEDEDVDLKMECFSNPSEEENITYYRDIIETLQAKNKFDVAREFADTIGLSTNQITVNKTQAAKQSTLVQQVSIKEKEQLLGLAYHWLARQHPPVQREELDKLEQQIWKCRIQKEVENAEKSPMGTEAIKLDEMFRLPESKRIEPYFGHLGKEELLIKEKYNIDRNTESPLTNTKERQAVDKLIGRQLDKCCVSQALKLANLFKYLSENLAIVMTCLQLAQGLQTVDQMDAMMKDLPKKHKDKRASWTLVGGTLSRSTSFASLSSVQTEYMSQDAEDILDAMETIAEHCILGKTACDRIINCYSIAQILNKSYESVVRQDCFDVLKEVLTSDHPHRFELSKTYIRSSGVNDEELAGFLSDAITHSLSVFTGYDFTDAPYTGGELIFSPVSNKENFPMLVKLCDDPAVLGNRLLDTAISLASSNTDNSSLVFTMETELIVRSHQCHTMCYSMEGIASVLRTCRSRSVVLAAAEEYSLLVRILTGVGRYSEMTYIFDILMKVQQFELLFKKGIKHDKLKVALLDYLKRHHPADKETFTMVALKFSMHREIAESLEHEAKTYLQHIQNQYRNIESSPELQSTLQNTLQFYTEAAQSYVKVGCRRHAEQCVKQARLLALQIHLLSSRTKVINLSQREVNIFIAKHPRFPEALIVSDAYGKRMEWSTAIYNNVVADGDFRYLDDFRHHLSLTSELYSELAVRYKHESSKSSTLTSNMKKVLLYCPDIQVQYRLATELGFNEMATTMLQGDGGAYLRDVT